MHLAAHHQSGAHALPIDTALLKAYSQAMQQKASNGALPLHLAAQYQTGKQTVVMVK